MLALQAAVAAVVVVVLSLLRPARMATYLIDFYCYRPPDRCLPRATPPEGLPVAAVEATWRLTMQALPTILRWPCSALCQLLSPQFQTHSVGGPKSMGQRRSP